MAEKDLYKILDIPATASPDEIKKAYRKLALKYHPDVNSGGKVVEAWFKQINEAYRVLSDPHRRSAYNQQRWYRESIVSANTHPPDTPEEMLRRCKAVQRYVDAIDHHRLNHTALQHYLEYLLNANNLEMLADWNDEASNDAIVTSLLAAARPLTYQRLLSVTSKLARIKATEGASLIEAMVKEKKRASYWKNYQLAYVLLIAAILCVLIYFAGR